MSSVAFGVRDVLAGEQAARGACGLGGGEWERGSVGEGCEGVLLGVGVHWEGDYAVMSG